MEAGKGKNEGRYSRNMKERISREGDEYSYQPRIHSDRIKELYKIGVETGLPITVLVDYAIRSYVNVYYEEKKKREDAQMDYELRSEDEEQEETEERRLRHLDEWEDGSMYGF